MKSLSPRQNLILEEIIRQYTETARPVSSSELGQRRDFGIKPAMLRIEMERLEEQGYLSQPFVSAGRVPTDKAYRFSVDRVMEKAIPVSQSQEDIENILSSPSQDFFRMSLDLIRLLARESSSMIFLNSPTEEIFLKEGWEEVLRAPEFESRDLLSEFADFLQDLEEKGEKLPVREGINVFIGQENPLGKATEFSLIAARCRLPQGQKAVVSLAGPKRMPYQKNISLMDSLIKALDEF